MVFPRRRGGVHGSGGTAAEEWRRLLLALRREEEGLGSEGEGEGETPTHGGAVGEEDDDGADVQLQALLLSLQAHQPQWEPRRLVGPIARVVVRLLQREPSERMDSAAAAEAVQGIRRRYLEVRGLSFVGG